MPPVGFEPTISAGKRQGRSPAEIVGSNSTGGIDICCECRVLSGRGLCDELITRPEESYRLCCVVVCDLETSRMGAPYIYDISRLRVKCGYVEILLEKSCTELCYQYALLSWYEIEIK